MSDGQVDPRIEQEIELAQQKVPEWQDKERMRADALKAAEFAKEQMGDYPAMHDHRELLLWHHARRGAEAAAREKTHRAAREQEERKRKSRAMARLKASTDSHARADAITEYLEAESR